jgi:hypothetical protein
MIYELQTNIDEIRSDAEADKNIIRQVKYHADSNKLNWINDIFAQIANNFYIAHATAVNLVFNSKTLTEINFSTKMKWREHIGEIRNLLNYLFGENIDQFIFEATREKFKKFIKKYNNNIDMDLYGLFIKSLDKNDDYGFIQYVGEIFVNLNENTIVQIKSDPYAIKEFYHLIVLFLDYLILPDIFMREFRKDMNTEIIINQYCHTIKRSDKKTHPDSKLAVAIRENCTNIEDNADNRIYIGVSHLCCVFCSVFLSTHLIDFRGRSGQFEKWNIPDKIIESIMNYELVSSSVR